MKNWCKRCNGSGIIRASTAKWNIANCVFGNRQQCPECHGLGYQPPPKERTMAMIHLGFEVKDKVTGFKGIVIGRTEWLNGCIRCAVQARVNKDGKIEEAVWIEEPQLEVIAPSSLIPKNKSDRGGPLPYVPQRSKNPKR